MNNRLKQIRLNKGLPMDKFAEPLGVTKAAISRLESGERNITDQMFNLICRVYKVNEAWLRTGEGEMFIDMSREDEIADFTLKLLKEAPDSFKNRLVSVLSRMTEDEWELLERKMREIIGD